MSALVTADIHLDTKPRNAHRWGLLPWLHKVAAELNASEILVLGDITDAKDRHPSELVNRLVDQADAIGQDTDLIFLQGNHDSIDPASPFLNFLNKGRSSVSFITKPTTLTLSFGDCLFLPSTDDVSTWPKSFAEWDFVFTHQTYDGAEAENGTLLPGIDPHILDSVRIAAYSGDIHVPQRFGKKGRYIGAPYRTRFGDSFTPHVIHLTKDGEDYLRFPCPGRHLATIRNPAELQAFGTGEQVKVRVEMRRADLPDWKAMREEIIQIAKTRGWELFGPELVRLPEERLTPGESISLANATKPTQAFAEFCQAKNLDRETEKAGLGILAGLTHA